jgi:flavin-dependent dehydrogenase
MTAGSGDRRAVVIGASLGGIFAAAALAAGGWAVTVLERDRLPRGADHRRGVPQDRQAHILLHRGLTAIEKLLPGFRTELLAREAVPFDTGQMPWLGDHGWLDTNVLGWEVVSATRPLMDAVARDLLRGLPGVSVVDGCLVNGLQSTGRGWRVLVARDDRELARDDDEDAQDEHGTATESARRRTGDQLTSSVVVDASGRGSRLAHWLPELASAVTEQVDAQVGYAGRLHAPNGSAPPLRTGMVIFGRPPDGASGLALPVERGQWMVSASGMGASRPPRDPSGFETFLSGLRDPAVADLVACLEPVGDVAVHRQTGNRRRLWGRHPDWPAGLLVMGDALCSFNPIYGQGITVAALQAELLRDALLADRPVDHRLQRALLAVTDVPWSIATGNDLRFPSCPDQPSRRQRLSGILTDRLNRLAATGEPRTTRTFSDVYHLMAPPAALIHPALLLAALRPLPTRRLPRPTVLEELSRVRREHPPPAPAGA